MASCYGGNRNSGNTGKLNVHEKCAYLPLVREIDYNGERVNVTINSFDDQDCYQQGYELMNEVIEEGKTWPFLEPFEHIDDYCAYYHSHASFAVKFQDVEKFGKDVLGTFYIKPNFPGRCAHICNGGFIVNTSYRGLGIGTVMGESFKCLAKDLGYKASLFNLVFSNNTASVKLWQKLGFTELCIIPKAARLKGCEGLVDAKQMYYDFEK